MRRALVFLLLLALGTCGQAENVPLSACKFLTNGRDELILRVPAKDGPQTVSLPAASILRTPEGDRVVTLREATLTLAAGGQAEGLVPAAALASKNAWQPGQMAQLTADTEPRLAPLLEFLRSRDDVPRATSQCVVFALLENVDFHQWQTWLQAGKPLHETDRAKAAGEAVSRAVEALVILRTIAPKQDFRLYVDAELKLRALRQPELRAAAQQVYQLSLPGDPLAAESQAPDISRLLHKKPGDNCPVCRMREQLQRPANDL